VRYHATRDKFIRLFLLHMLAAYKGNRTQTARTLGLQRSYLLRLLRRHKVKYPRPGE